jgi:hypothetical protein
MKRNGRGETEFREIKTQIQKNRKLAKPHHIRYHVITAHFLIGFKNIRHIVALVVLTHTHTHTHTHIQTFER